MSKLTLWLFLLAIVCESHVALCQHSWSSSNLSVSENFTGFAGSGFAPDFGPQYVNSSFWSLTGISDGNIDVGDTVLNGDAARGTTAGGVSAGGVYAFQVPADTGMLFQPTGSDLTPGVVTTFVVNSLPIAVNEFSISSHWKFLNNNGRSSAVRQTVFTRSDTLCSTFVLGVTPTSADAEGVQVLFDSTHVIRGRVNSGDTLFVAWTMDDEAGSGGRDELILTSIEMEARIYPPELHYSGSLTMHEDRDATVAIVVHDEDTDVADHEILDVASVLSEVTYEMSGDSLLVTLQPMPDTHGVDTLFISLSDGLHVVDSVFTIEILPVNDAPEIVVPDSLQFWPHDTIVVPTSIHDDQPVGQLHVRASSASVHLDFTVDASRDSIRIVLPCHASTTHIVEISVDDGELSTTANVALQKHAVPLPTLQEYPCSLIASLCWEASTRAQRTAVYGGSVLATSRDGRFEIAQAQQGIDTLVLVREFHDGCSDTLYLPREYLGVVLQDDSVCAQAEDSVQEVSISILANDVLSQSPDSIALLYDYAEFELRGLEVVYTGTLLSGDTAQCQYRVYAESCNSTATVSIYACPPSELPVTGSTTQFPEKYVLDVGNIAENLICVDRQGLRLVSNDELSMPSSGYSRTRSSTTLLAFPELATAAKIGNEIVTVVFERKIVVYEIVTGGENIARVHPCLEYLLPSYLHRYRDVFLAKSAQHIALLERSGSQLCVYRVARFGDMKFIQVQGSIALPKLMQTDHCKVAFSDREDILFTASFLGTKVHAWQYHSYGDWELKSTLRLPQNGTKTLEFNSRTATLAILNWRMGSVSIATSQNGTLELTTQQLKVCDRPLVMGWINDNTLFVGCGQGGHNQNLREARTTIMCQTVPSFARRLTTSNNTGTTISIFAIGYQKIKEMQFGLAGLPP